MGNLIGAIESLIERHGGLRAAARAVQVDPAYLSRLRAGKQRRPGAETLRKLGLRVNVTHLKAKGNHK